MAIVIRATDDDLKTIFTWLKVEYDQDGGAGFWHNRDIIAESYQERSDLYVVRENGEAVSFQIGDYGPVITSTRKMFRNRGYATALLNESIYRAHRDGVNVLYIQCSSRESWDYWKRRGFQRYDNMSGVGVIRALMILPKQFDLPSDRPRVRLKIEFYPEEVKKRENVAPLCSWAFDSAVLLDGSYQLPERVSCLKSEIERGDLIIRIEADGREIYFGKAKYDGAKAAGVVKDATGLCFYVDRVAPPLTHKP
jgi:GNAT superfamily N-acetyltransferase